MKGLGFAPNAALTGQAGWLDVANVYLNPADPSRFDVIELRVFDHKTRRLLTNRDGMGASFYPSSPPVVQLRALGERLPGAVDVWFRASSHEAGEPVIALKGEVGSSAAVARGTLSIREVRHGRLSYSVKYPPWPKHTEYEWVTPPFATEAPAPSFSDWEGEQVEPRYQICAVGRDGRKVFPDVPQFLTFPPNKVTGRSRFKIAKADLSHFELRPFGDRRTFYFDNVILPAVGQRPFGALRRRGSRVDGREVERHFTEFSPIRVWLSLRKGRCSDGISSEGFLTPTKPIEGLDTDFTAFISVEGVAGGIWELYLHRPRRQADRPAIGRSDDQSHVWRRLRSPRSRRVPDPSGPDRLG